jgi:hypothetical protein
MSTPVSGGGAGDGVRGVRGGGGGGGGVSDPAGPVIGSGPPVLTRAVVDAGLMVIDPNRVKD